MAVLEKIRVRMGIFITVIIGLALISFIIDANTLRSVTSMFSSKNDVGKINGKSISYQDFSKKQDYYVQVHTLLTGSSVLSDQMQEQVREQTWQDFFKEDVLYPQYAKSGIEVSPKELVDLAQGRYVSPILQQDPVFAGENGSFSRANVLGFIRSIDGDQSGSRAAYWKYCEDRMRDAQLLEKYLSLLTQSRYSNSLDLKRKIADRNTTVDISYVAQMIGSAPDSSIKITESAARDYYKKHQREFEQETSRDIEYVALPIEPSNEDIALTEELTQKIYAEFVTTKTADLDKFVSRNSDVTYTGKYYKKGELPAKLDSFAFHATVKDVLPVYRDGYTYYMARIVNSRMLPDSVRARHILIQNRDIKAANHTADSLILALNHGANFGYVAQQYSADKAANQKDGDLGWFSQGSMVKAFEDTCFVAPKNKLIKVETNFGVHIVEVTERSQEQRKVQLAVVEKTSNPGKNTYQAIFTEANNLASASDNKRQQFETLAATKNMRIIPGYSLKEGQKQVGPMANARELVRWAYAAKVDDVSAVLTLDNYFVVATLVVAREQGIAPFEQVRPEIESALQREEKSNQLAQKMKEVMTGVSSIEALAEKAGLSVGTAADLSFTGRSIAGIGFDPKLQGAVASAQENTLSGPVKGATGVYVFTVTRRYTGTAYTVEDEKMRERYSSAQNDFYDFYNVMQKYGKVQDWRGRFF